MSSTICALPWTHLNIDPNGDVYPCCLTTFHGQKLGNLNLDSVENIWNSDSMKSLRLEMMQGKKPKICSICFDRESATGQSVRIYNNREFKDVVRSIPEITSSNGSVKEMKLKYWDFRFSNICNFKCRSCVPNLSSSWIPDARKLGLQEIDTKIFEIKHINNSSVYKFIDENIDHVEKIYFAGGEPLLMDEHWYVINRLIEKKKFNVKLYYSTNLSNLEYKNQKITDLWKLWPQGKIEICPSIDEIDDRAELIRSGTDWSKIEKNLISVSQIKNIFIKPSITVSVFNVSRITEIIDRLLKLNVITNKSNFHINLLQTPIYYHVSLLSRDHKQSLIKHLESYIGNYETDITYHFSYLINELNKKTNDSDLEKFREITKKLDEIRNEDTAAIIPEISYLLNTY